MTSRSGKPGNGSGEKRDARQERLIDRAWEQIRAANIQEDQPFAGTALPPALDADSFPGYQLQRIIHRGGQGVVYHALQRSTDRRVAIKVVKEGPHASPSDLARFRREVDFLARLKNPHIVTIYDSGATAGWSYFVMDYVDGQPLDIYLAGTKLPLRNKLRLFAAICDGVNAAHLSGVIHRDLKPSNILIDEHGAPRILDFGLAKPAGTQATTATATGQFIGSLPWASPEQITADSAPLDMRTDVYSLGVMLYYALTRRFPYNVTGNVHAVMDRILHEEPLRPGKQSRKVDHELDTIVLKCLEKERDRRYQTAGNLARDLRHYLACEPIEAKRDSAWYTVRKTIQRYKYAFAGTAIVVLLAVAFVIATLVQSARVAGERDRALMEAERARRIQAFLESMFASIQPEQMAQPELIRAVLDDGASRVDIELADFPATAADVHETLGTTYDSIGLHDEAVYHLNRAIDLRQEALGPDHPTVAAALTRLASALHNKQDLFSAEQASREVLRRYHRLLGPTHARVAEAMNELASILVQQNKLDEAEALARGSLESRQALFGAEHPVVADSMTTLGAALRDLGRYDEAEWYLQAALDMRRRLQGPPYTTGALTHLAELHRLRGKLAEAEKVLREVIAIRREHLRERHPALAWNLYCLCDVLLEAGITQEAELLCREALAIQQVNLGAQHPDLSQYLRLLARVLIANGARNEAEELLAEAKAIDDAGL